jgi:hypothetical protein
VTRERASTPLAGCKYVTVGVSEIAAEKIREVIMVDKFLRVVAALGFALFSFALPASAQDTMRIRC